MSEINQYIAKSFQNLASRDHGNPAVAETLHLINGALRILAAKVEALEKMFEHHPRPPRTADEATVKQWEQHHKPPASGGPNREVDHGGSGPCPICGVTASHTHGQPPRIDPAPQAQGREAALHDFWRKEAVSHQLPVSPGAQASYLFRSGYDAAVAQRQRPARQVLDDAATPEAQQGAPDLLSRIQSYLCNGGLFNPEMMEHDKVRDLLVDCREALVSQQHTSRIGSDWMIDSSLEKWFPFTAEELSRLRDLVRWRDADNQNPTDDGNGYTVLVEFNCVLCAEHATYRGGKWWACAPVRYWRPIGPLPDKATQ